MKPERVTDGLLPHLRYAPEMQNYPLILFLHGSGERGNDLEHVGDHGLKDILERLPEPTLVLVPHPVPGREPLDRPLSGARGHPRRNLIAAPRLAKDFTVVCPDLRGYGDSSKPPTAPDHESYSKRAMARDMVSVMGQLGFARFSLAGHDQGGYVSYRLALEHAERVEKLAVLNIVPAGEAWRRANATFMLNTKTRG